MSSEALGNRHSALRCGIQKTPRMHKMMLIAYTGFRIGVRNDDYRVPHWGTVIY